MAAGARWAILVVCAVGSACVGGRDGGPGDPGCVAPQIVGDTRALEIDLRFDGYDRSYVVHVPPALNPAEPHPLVLSFHGQGSGALDQMDLSQLNVTADARRFLVVYPEGLFGSWNAGACCGRSAADAIDDVAFVRAIVSDLRQKVCVDTRRIYATGMAWGASFTHRLACDAPDLIAAAAPVSGALELASCSPSRPVPLLMMQGTDDEISDPRAAQTSFGVWQALDGCSSGAAAREGRCDVNASCSADARVGLCLLDGFAHCWPGNPDCPFGRATSPLDFSANVEMWRFFERHRLP